MLFLNKDIIESILYNSLGLLRTSVSHSLSNFFKNFYHNLADESLLKKIGSFY